MSSRPSESIRESTAAPQAAEHAQAHTNLVDLTVDFMHSAVYSGLQAPITGVAQLVDEVAGTHLDKSTSFIPAPGSAQFGSADWHAQQLGSAVGTVFPFLAVHKGMSAAFGDAAIMSNPIAHGAGSGVIFGSILQPSEVGDNFWSSRLKNGVTSGVTFGALGGINSSLTTLSESQALSGTAVQRLLGNRVVSGIVSGVPAGLVGAETESILQGKGLASGENLFQSAYSYGLIGGAVGAFGSLEKAPIVKSNEIYSPPTTSGNGIDAALSGRSAVELVSKPAEESVVQTKTPELATHGRDGMEVVLGAGGVRGFGLVGFLRYLEESKVKIGTETGVSIGSIVSALHANGYSSRQIEQIMKDELVHPDMQSLAPAGHSWRHPLRALGSHFVSMRSSMEGFVDKYNLSPQDNLRIVAYNLKTRKPIVFEGRNYDLAEALAASSSIPGAMRPVYYRPFKGELPESMRKSGLLVDGGAYRMAPSEFSDEPAIIAKISSQSPFPSIRGRSLRELPSLIQPAIFAAFKKRYTEPSGPHFVVSAGDTSVSALDMNLPDVKINDLIDYGYAQAKSTLGDHVAQGSIPLDPAAFSMPAVEAVPAARSSFLTKLLSRLHRDRSS